MERVYGYRRGRPPKPPQQWCVAGDVATAEIGGSAVVVGAEDASLVGQYRWFIDGRGYAWAKAASEVIGMHRLVMGLSYGDPREADHIHHLPLDNRKGELRIATAAQNSQNRRGNAACTSRFKGVCWDASRKRWLAQIDSKHIGRFLVEEEAARAYDRAAVQRFGAFAFVNNV